VNNFDFMIDLSKTWDQ